MGYIEIKEETIQVKRLSCSHKIVSSIWEYGGMSMPPTSGDAFRYICLLLTDGTVKRFVDNGNGDAINEAELFLQNQIG